VGRGRGADPKVVYFELLLIWQMSDYSDNVWFQKISIPCHGWLFGLTPLPHPSRKSTYFI